MNGKRRRQIGGALGVAVIVALALSAYLLSKQLSWGVARGGDFLTSTAIVMRQTIEAQLHQTQTADIHEGSAFTLSPTPNPFPYDPILYGQRHHQEMMMRTGAGPTEYAIFYATETALVATYQGTILPTFTPIPYTADMSPTALPEPTYLTRTAIPTLCPPSDVVCPGGNATANPAQQVMMLMASAEGTEFRQLALTATALATSPTPTVRVSPTLTPTSSTHDSNCAFSWAHQDLPEVAEAAQKAFSATDKQIEVLRADAYGENCNRADGSVSYFGAMTTDFYLNANVSNLNDDNELAQVVVTAYKTLTALKVKLPAAPGYLDILFTANGATKHFRAMFYQLNSAIEAGIGGESLLEIGGLR